MPNAPAVRHPRTRGMQGDRFQLSGRRTWTSALARPRSCRPSTPSRSAATNAVAQRPSPRRSLDRIGSALTARHESVLVPAFGFATSEDICFATSEDIWLVNTKRLSRDDDRRVAKHVPRTEVPAVVALTCGAYVDGYEQFSVSPSGCDRPPVAARLEAEMTGRFTRAGYVGRSGATGSFSRRWDKCR
jgi:hypothetical protein